MLIRVCGATEERDGLSRSRCWCRGLFCGPRGAKRTQEFRRDVHKTTVASSIEQFEDLLSQVDLFDGLAKRDKWLARLGPREVSTHGKRSTRSVRRAVAPGARGE